MSHLKIKGKPRGNKRNVLDVFSKHFKSQTSTPVPTTACCTSCKHADGSETLQSNVVAAKGKRLKTRKERDQMKQGCNGQKIRSHSRHKQSCGREGFLGSSQSLSHSHSQQKFAKAFPSKEPSFITDRRLIGHQGMFNHEVKSFDIERLLSEERKAARSKKQVDHTEKMSSPALTPTHNSGNERECPPKHKNEVSGKCRRQGISTESRCGILVRSQRCSQSEDKGRDRGTANQESGVSPSQKKAECMELSPSDSNSVVILSSTPKSSASSNMQQSTPRISPERHKGPQVLCAESPLQPESPRTSAQHSERTPTCLKPQVPYTKAQKPNNTPDSHVTKKVSSASLHQKAGNSETERAQLEARIASHLISVVAGRLCQSLERPILMRHNLLAESRSSILHALHERHRTELQENLLRLHSRLGPGQSEVDSKHGSGMHSDAPEDKCTALIDSQCSGTEPDIVQQKPTSKRRRKQTCPQRRTPADLPPPQGPLIDHSSPRRPQALPWSFNMGTQQKVQVKPANTFSVPFSLGPQTTHNTSLTVTNTLSEWRPHTGLPQHWNKQYDQEDLHLPPVSNTYEKWMHDSDVSFHCQAEYQAQHRNPYYSYTAMPQDGANREPQHLTVHQHFDYKRHLANACSPDSANASLKNLQLQPYFRFHHPLSSANPSVPSYGTDMDLYPPSELLDVALSPPRFPSASPEGWSYPRMRLY
ncbi:hypothetical protein ACEWY4_019744 [Coilia grayii]|uniref:Uncharacterized protein n=1 Tax=Coilia grayii TaxID=363190 RepID=A0ABD1JBU3_9TELE